MESRTLSVANAAEVAEWCEGVLVEEKDPFDSSKITPGINLQCGPDVKRASLGDTIVRYICGTFDVHNY